MFLGGTGRPGQPRGERGVRLWGEIEPAKRHQSHWRARQREAAQPIGTCTRPTRADWRYSGWLTALTSSGGLDRDTVITTVEEPSSCRFLPTTKRVNLSVPEKSGFAK